MFRFLWKEQVYIGYDEAAYLRVCRILQNADIRYKNKVSVPSDRWAGPGFNMRGDTGLGINPSQARLFEVWVAAADYDQARFLIRGGD